MGWPLALIFLGWLGYGFWQWRRNGQLLRGLSRIPRRKRALWAATLMLGSGIGLMGFLSGLGAAGGISKTGIAAWGYPWIALAGLAFVHCQTMASAMVVSLGVTLPPPDSSVAKSEE